MTHYETLGVSQDATQADIKSAYRKAAMTNHPDREGGNEVRFQAVNRANEVLSDPDKRAAYDRGEDPHANTAAAMEQAAVEGLLSLFSLLIDKPDEDEIEMIDLRSQMLANIRAGFGSIKASKQKAQSQRIKLLRLRRKMKTKEHFFPDFVRQRRLANVTAYQTAKSQQLLFNRMLTLAEDFQYDFDKPQIAEAWGASGHATTGFNTPDPFCKYR